MQQLLADASTTITIPLSPIVVVVMGTIGLIPVVASVVTIFKSLQKQPPDHDRYASKESVGRVEQRLNDRIDHEVHERERLIEQIHADNEEAARMRTSNNKELQSIHAQLGRLSGLLEILTKKPR